MLNIIAWLFYIFFNKILVCAIWSSPNKNIDRLNLSMLREMHSLFCCSFLFAYYNSERKRTGSSQKKCSTPMCAKTNVHFLEIGVYLCQRTPVFSFALRGEILPRKPQFSDRSSLGELHFYIYIPELSQNWLIKSHNCGGRTPPWCTGQRFQNQRN